MLLFTILEAFIIAASLSLDAFTASFAYGSSKIKIPILSVQIITIICSSILGLSLLIGTAVKQYIPNGVTVIICFILLFVLGIISLLNSITKSIIKKHTNLNKELKFSLFNFRFILSLCANPEAADVDLSKTISPTEAVSLAIALSLDGFAVGFGAALANVNGLAIFLCSLITGMIAVILGCYLGNKIASKTKLNLSWLSGVILIILAFSKLF